MKTRSVLLAGLFLVLLPSLMAFDATAAVVRHVGFEELVGGSDVIFHGRVALVEDQPESTRETGFFTRIHLEIIELVAGLPAEQATIVLEIPGGVRGNKKLVIPGMPRFMPGDEVVLLLEKLQDERGLIFTGLSQGVYWVRRDGLGPKVHRNLGELTLVRGSEHSHGGIEPQGTLQGLLARLRKLVLRRTP